MSGNYITTTHNSPSQKTNTWRALCLYMMGSVVQPLLKWGWNCTNILVSKTFEVSVLAKLPVWNQPMHIWTTSCKHYSSILHEMNLVDLDNHVPSLHHKKYTLKNDLFFLGSFTKDIKGKRKHRKQTSFEPLRHVTEEQHERTDSQGQREGNDEGMDPHKSCNCSRS